jgi:hypothetical protein
VHCFAPVSFLITSFGVVRREAGGCAKTGHPRHDQSYDSRLGMSDARIEPCKGLVDCGPPPGPGVGSGHRADLRRRRRERIGEREVDLLLLRMTRISFAQFWQCNDERLFHKPTFGQAAINYYSLFQPVLFSICLKRNLQPGFLSFLAYLLCTWPVVG